MNMNGETYTINGRDFLATAQPVSVLTNQEIIDEVMYITDIISKTIEYETWFFITQRKSLIRRLTALNDELTNRQEE